MTSNKVVFLGLLLLMNCIYIYPQTTIIIMTTGTGFTNQTWRYTGEGKPLDEPTIKKNWNEDYYITSAAYTSHGWFFAMSKSLNWTNQSYKIASDWPDSYIHIQRNKGYMITTLAASENNWFIVTSANTEITDQQICSAPLSGLKEWILEWRRKNYYITNITCKNKLWTVVMSKTNQFIEQSYCVKKSADELNRYIKEKMNNGYIITACEYGSNDFFCIMSKTQTSATDRQSYFIEILDDPSSYIKEISSKDYKITYIGG